MPPKLNVYFRADGNAKMGLGHVIRSLALAEMLRPDFICHFLSRNPLPSLLPQMQEVCASVLALPEPESDLQEAEWLTQTQLNPSAIVVLDGYHFKTEYQAVLKRHGCKVVCIDDIHAYHFLADAVINHAGGIAAADYQAESYTAFYLGLRYALLRQPFREAARQRLTEKPDNLFLCLGGADPNNDTLEILKALEIAQEPHQCYLVLGGAYAHRAALDRFLEQTSLKITVLNQLSAAEMVRYMNLCRRAITPPSTVAYEYLSTGGALWLKVIADNQLDMYDFFVRSGLAFRWDDFFNQNFLNTILNTNKNPFDGQQERRLKAIFFELSLQTRLATLADCDLYFEWTNDPLTRQQSFNTAPILYPQHRQWFEQRLNDKNSRLLVLSLGDVPVGQIRFGIDGNTATINYALDNRFRGKGLGVLLLNKGIAWLRATEPNLKIIGYVKQDNLASVRCFRQLNFVETVAITQKNTFKYTYENL